LEAKVSITKAILLVGGEGTRLRPLTLSHPKPMLPVAGFPITAHQIAKLAEVGITEVVLATSYQASVFNDWLKSASYLPVEITIVVEETPLGTGGAIRNAADHLGLAENESVMVLNGDVLSGHSLQKQIDQYETATVSASLHLVCVENPAAFGLVPTDENYQVKAFLEKPTKPEEIVTNQINAGCYVLGREAINQIAPGQPSSVERDIFPKLLASGYRIFGYLDNSYFLDLGTPYSYIQGSSDLVQQIVYSPLVKTKSEALIDSSAEVDSSAIIFAGSVVSAGAKVGSGAIVSGSIIEKGAVVGDGAQVFDSYLGENSIIENQLILSRVVIGANCSVGVEIPPGVRVWPSVSLVTE